MPPYDFKTVDELEGLGRSFVLDPVGWSKFQTQATLDWWYVPFESSYRTAVPTTRGVYAFVVEYTTAQFPPHGYLMYIGISGNSNQRTLRLRYSDYLRGVTKEKRERVKWMLNKFQGCLFFYFAEVSDRRIDLAKLETDLLNVTHPPCNKADFSGAKIKTARAFR
jgi:hypothetical protein